MQNATHQRIFLVDDDPFWTAILEQLLNNLGYTEIYCFASGTECVANLHLNPALVFLDYQMDDMDGLTVLKRIKAHYPGIGVVFCTAHEDLSIAVDAIELGSCDYLLKSNANVRSVSATLESTPLHAAYQLA